MNPGEEYLIKNTTREQRAKIVEDSLGNINGSCDGCAAGILKMYDDYINGVKELSEVNAEFHRNYTREFPEKNNSSCMM